MGSPALKHVLLIEDDLDINTVLQMALTEIGGFAVDAATTGRDGIKLARLRRPQLILLDVMLPDIDGVEVLKALRATPETHDIPVVFLSATIERLDRDALGRMGALAFLAKPVDLTRLLTTLDEVWEVAIGAVSKATAC